LIAYVTGAGAEPAALRAALARELPDYMVPSAVLILETLPLTQNGKVDRKALPAPDMKALAAQPHAAQRDPVVEALCRIWAELLEDVEQVEANDNFFELGGHSLLAVTLIERMREEGLESDVESLFEHPTPAGLAATLRGGSAVRDAVAEKLCRIWAEVLGVERVEPNDNFFELGGHSLLAVTLIERMREKGLESDVEALFEHPTPAGLASKLETGGGAIVPPNLIPPRCAAITPDMVTLARLSQEEIDLIVATVPGGAANVQDIYPLAPLQEGMLFHHLLAEQADPYQLESILACASREQLEAFVATLQRVVARHDILRTAIVWEGLSEPMQVVWREAPLAVEEISLDAARDALEALQARRKQADWRLDVRQAPMLRVAYARDAAKDRWVICVAYHHLVDDGRTLALVGEEMLADLAGRREENAPAPPFRDFVARTRVSTRREEQEAYFRSLLGDVAEPTTPFNLSQVEGDGSGVSEASLELETELSLRLRARARALGVTPASLIHLAFALVLARTSGRSDVVFGTVLLGRMYGGAEADRGVGIFINTLPLRLPLGAMSVAAGALETQTRLRGLLAHEHASLALAQRCSGVEAPTPLFSALLNYQHAPLVVESERRSSAGIETLRGQEGRTNYPLTLSVSDYGERFSLDAQTQSPLAAERLNAFMQAALERLVSALEEAPGTRLVDIDVLPPQERALLLSEWTASPRAYAAADCLPALFEAQAARAPASIAVVYEGEALSYGELNARANRLAHRLRAEGVGPDVLVGLCV
ncbi:MAG TPA: condensation domain-containing protein, partial [Methylocystis sp.]|nr:condensation domain-containing protein [Methylocystis sp.]